MLENKQYLFAGRNIIQGNLCFPKENLIELWRSGKDHHNLIFFDLVTRLNFD